MKDKVTIVRNGNPIKGIKKGIEKGNLALCIQTVGQAKALAPVDLGQLRNAIMYKTPEGPGAHNDSGGLWAPDEITARPRKDEAYVGINLAHGIYQEFGTRHTAPQPYLRPAIDVVVKGSSSASVLKKIQEEEMRGALKKGQKRETF